MGKMVLTAEFPAIPSSAIEIASERRCAILVDSDEERQVKGTFTRDITERFLTLATFIRSENKVFQPPMKTTEKMEANPHETHPFGMLLVVQFYIRWIQEGFKGGFL